MAWRCNGQSECVGEETSLGSDERDCDYEDYENTHESVNQMTTNTVRATTTTTTTSTISPTPSLIDEWFQIHKVPYRAPAPPHNGTCGGVLNNFYGSFWPAAWVVPPRECVWTVDPQDSRPLRLELQVLELGPQDTINITDQRHGAGNVIKTVNLGLFASCSLAM